MNGDWERHRDEKGKNDGEREETVKKRPSLVTYFACLQLKFCTTKRVVLVL